MPETRFFERVVASDDPETTRALAARLAAVARPGDLLCLVGELGAGKTQFAKGFAVGLGITDTVSSPTFVLMTEYAGRLPMFHVDLYRLDDAADALAGGLLDERQARGGRPRGVGGAPRVGAAGRAAGRGDRRLRRRAAADRAPRRRPVVLGGTWRPPRDRRPAPGRRHRDDDGRHRPRHPPTAPCSRPDRGSPATGTARSSCAQIEALLAEQGVARGAIGGLVVGTGPGAFTGLRVGIATVKGLAYALHLPVVGVPTGAALLRAAAASAGEARSSSCSPRGRPIAS